MNKNPFQWHSLGRRLFQCCAGSHRPRWVEYTFAVVATAIMLAVRLGITVSFGERPLLILFILPIILAAALGGLGPGLVSTLIAGVSAAYFMPPAGRFWISQPYDIFQWLLLLVDGILVSSLSEQLHRARQRAENAARQQIVAAGALRESDEQIRLLVQSVTDYAIIRLDAQGNVASWNEGAKRIKGYATQEIVGRHFSRFYCEEDIKALVPEAQLKAAAETGHFEEVGLRARKDGSTFWANVVITPIGDALGGVTGYSKVTRDITERKQAEDLIRESHALLTRQKAALEATLGRIKRLEGLLPICMQCKKIRTGNNDWHQLEKYIGEHSDAVFSHGICPECLDRQLAQLETGMRGSGAVLRSGE